MIRPYVDLEAEPHCIDPASKLIFVVTPAAVFDEASPLNVFCRLPEERSYDIAVALVSDLSQPASKNEPSSCT